jgi:hypothetical protein
MGFTHRTGGFIQEKLWDFDGLKWVSDIYQRYFRGN